MYDLLFLIIFFFISTMSMIGLYFTIYNNFPNLFSWINIFKIAICLIFSIMNFVYAIRALKEFLNRNN